MDAPWIDGPPDQPEPEPMLLQARKQDGGDWIEIWPSQLEWIAKQGYDVRALTEDQVYQQLRTEK